MRITRTTITTALLIAGAAAAITGCAAPTITPAATTAPAACTNALGHAAALDGMWGEFRLLAAAGSDAIFDRSATRLDAATAQVNALNTRIAKAQADYAADAAACR